MPTLFDREIPKFWVWAIPILVTVLFGIPAWLALLKGPDAPPVLPPDPLKIRWSPDARPQPATVVLLAPRIDDQSPGVAHAKSALRPNSGAAPSRPGIPPAQAEPASEDSVETPPNVVPVILPAPQPKVQEPDLSAPATTPIVLDRIKLAPNQLHSVCGGRLQMKFLRSVVGGPDAQAIRLSVPIKRYLQQNETLQIEGCSLTFQGLERTAQTVAVFKFVWTEED